MKNKITVGVEGTSGRKGSVTFTKQPNGSLAVEVEGLGKQEAISLFAMLNGVFSAYADGIEDD